MNAKIRILIVDDHPLVREGLQAVISMESDMEIVGKAADGRAAMCKATRLQPDVILMDLLMPEMSGDEAIAAILEEQGDDAPRVLVLTSVDDLGTLRNTIQLGVSGYVHKNAPPRSCLMPFGLSIEGASCCPSRWRGPCSRTCRPPTSPPDPAEALTGRELEVLRLVAQGLNNDDIAERLVISPRTVSVHVSHILGKLNLDNRTQAALYALRTGLGTL